MKNDKRSEYFPNIAKQKIGFGYGPNITLPSSELSRKDLKIRLEKDTSKFLTYIHYDQYAPEGGLRDDVFEQGAIEELCDGDFTAVSRVWKEKF
jgi:hypothetical protein